ncbi:DUF5317 family protein [Pseudalkalibacillus sp. A8]|uniref:DUF5317 family protein n=1 Tax=Pseudalkalibacillus sp. A8 TaxID=3382641 RepID=UPI0038B5E2F7
MGLLPTILFLQIGVFLFQAKMDWLSSISAFIFIGVYIVGLVFLWVNRKLGFGVQLILVGVLLNFIVIIANDGRMPVSLEAAKVLDPSYSEALEVGN